MNYKLVSKCLILLICAMLMSGCSSLDKSNIKDSESDISSSDVDNSKYNWSVDNALLENVNTSMGIQGTEDGFYYVKNNNIIFRDSELKCETVLCNNQGCKHDSLVCPAYVENCISVASYRNKIYALVKEVSQENSDDNSGQVCLYEISSSGKRKEISLYKTQNCADLSVYNVQFAYGYAYYIINESMDLEEKSILIQVDLAKASTRRKSFDSNVEARIIAGCENGLYINKISIEDKNLKAQEEFLKENKDADKFDYYEYKDEYYHNPKNKKSEIAKLDINLDDSEVIESENIMSSDCGLTSYGDILVYVKKENGNSNIYIYDIIRQKKVCINSSKKPICEYMLIDGKIIYPVEKGDEAYEFHMLNIYTNEDKILDNNKQDKSIYFAIEGESKGEFVGNSVSVGKPQFLSKEAYYKEKYEDVEE